MNQYTVFFDENTAYPIKIHKRDCIWREKYEEHILETVPETIRVILSDYFRSKSRSK